MSAPSTVERTVSRVLLWGGLLSVALMLGGLVLYAVQGHPHMRDVLAALRTRQPGVVVDVFTSLADVQRGLRQRPPDALAITALGLVCLLATPVTGIALAIVAFWDESDRQYAIIAAIVLTMLLASLALASGA